MVTTKVYACAMLIPRQFGKRIGTKLPAHQVSPFLMGLECGDTLRASHPYPTLPFLDVETLWAGHTLPPRFVI